MRSTVAAVAAAAVAACAPLPALGQELATGVWPHLSCYAAASLGFAVVGVNIDAGGHSIPVNADGALTELAVGCDARLGDVIVGPWGSFTLSDSQARVKIDPDVIRIDIDHKWALGLRAGYDLSDDVMIFAKGGYVTAKTDGDIDSLEGYVIGAGVETMLTKHLGIRFEADHTRYKGETIKAGEGDPAETAVKAGAVVKF